MQRWTLITLWTLAGLLGLGFAVAHLVYEDLRPEEGVNLYAAIQIPEGQLPYRDYAYLDAPGMPFVYAGAARLLRSQGMAAGRALTVLFGFAAWLLTARLAWRCSSRSWGTYAGVSAFLLCAVNAAQIESVALARPHGLAALLLVGGFLALSRVRVDRRWPFAGVGGLLLGLATGVDLVAVAALAGGGVFVVQGRKAHGTLPLAAYFATAVPALALVYGPWLGGHFAALAFGVYGFHVAQPVDGVGHLIALKAGALASLLAAYPVTLTLGLVLVLRRGVFGYPGPIEYRTPRGFGTAILISLGLAVTLVLAAPHPRVEALASFHPLFAATMAASLTTLLSRMATSRAVGASMAGLLLALSVAVVFATPRVAGWFLDDHGHLRMDLLARPPLLVAREVGAQLRKEQRRGEYLLTQDVALAIESGLRLPPGLETGPFAYFPDWPRASTEALHLVNREQLDLLIRQHEAVYAAVGPLTLRYRMPDRQPPAAADTATFREQFAARFDQTAAFTTSDGSTNGIVLLRRKTAPALNKLPVRKPGAGAGEVSLPQLVPAVQTPGR